MTKQQLQQEDEDFTKQLLKDGTEDDVGDLAREADLVSSITISHQYGTPHSEVFLSHTGYDIRKEEIERPTHWFLTGYCQVKAF